MQDAPNVNDGEISLPIVACCNLISDDEGRFLLVQEAKSSARSRYNLPAGKLEMGETLIEAAVREAKEESGLEVTVSHLVGIYHCPATSEGFAVVNFVFFSNVVGGSLASSLAHPIVSYFSHDEIKVLSDRRMLRGVHVSRAIADHLAGVAYPSALVRTVAASAR